MPLQLSPRVAMVAFVAWGAYIIFYRIKNDSKAYKTKSA